jgi:RhoGAP domain
LILVPEPILTHALAPYFEAVLSAETHSRESQETPHASRGMRRPADVAGPKPDGNVPTLRKPPSLSTLAMPNFSGMRAPSESLVNALRSLIAGLPQENRDLLHTVTDLISATARRSKETKMPLSNLLLVFCPSLNMNPPLLRVLCEAEGIWDVPPNPSQQQNIVDTKQETIMMDIGSDTPRPSESPSTNAEEVLDSTSDEVTSQESHASAGREILPEATATTQQRPERIGSPAYGPRPLFRAPFEARRETVATLYLDSECADDLVSQSFVESPAADVLPPGATSSESLSSKDESSVNRSNSGSPALPNFNSPPSLSSSTDSLTSSETPSSSHLPLPEDHLHKTKISSRMPAIVDPADLALPRTPQRSATCPTIGGDIQFPSTPSMPISTLIGRPSVPKLSLNVSTPQLHGLASASSLRTRRIKKPSLHLLFTRRSSASLHSPVNPSTPNPYLQPPHSASPLSSPLSAQQSVYTPQTSTSSLPPVLNLPIETSPLKIGMGIDEDKRRTIGAKPSSSHSNHTVIGLTTDEPSLPSPGTRASSETPIASLYSTPSSSVLSFDTNTNTQPLRPRARPRKSQGSLASSSFNHLSVVLPDEEAVEDGWAQSVLAAADTDGSWSPRNVLKFFGGGSS